MGRTHASVAFMAVLCVAVHAQHTAQQRAHSFVLQRGAAASHSVAVRPAAAQLLHADAAATSAAPVWQPLGPAQVSTALYGKVTGRITSIAVDPADLSGNTLYLGTTGGGVWKSTDGASHFSPLTDALNFGGAVPSLSIGAVTLQPGGNGVVLAGTGDPNDATDSYYGEGVLRSTDSGATWALVAASSDEHSFAGEGFSGFAWSTLTPNLVVAAVSQSEEGTIVNAGTVGSSARGLYYSLDAGATWQMASLSDGAQTIQSSSSSSSSFAGNAVTAVVWNALRQRFYAAVRYHGYYESTDGQAWTRMANQPGANLTTANCPARANTAGDESCPMFRGVLAVQPVTGDLFALTVDVNHADVGLWRDTCALSGASCADATVTWSTQLNTTPLEVDGTIPQGDYNLTLAAIPHAGDTLLFAGTQEIFRCSLAGGCAFRNTTNATTGCAAPAGVAPAQHAIAWTANAIYFGNDGGLWGSTDFVNQTAASCSADDASHFQNLNGALGSLAEISALASDPQNADIVLAAIGVNGSVATTTATTSTAWTQLSSGESGTVAIDESHWYIQSGSGVSILNCAQGSSCSASDFTGAPTLGLTQVSGDASLQSPPFLLDPALPSNAILGTCRVWRGPASNGALWPSSNVMSAPLGGTADGLCDGSSSLIRSLAAGGALVSSSSTQNSGSPVLYAGMAGTLDGGGAWGGHLFSTIAANTASGATAWADQTSSSVSNDSANAFRFNPGDFDLSSLYADPHDSTGKTVYVTVMGFGSPHLYRSTNAGATWLNVSANLPDAPANAVVVDPNDANTVYVGTDAGVFVTSAITNCATQSCWASYGTGLPPSPVITLEAQAALTVWGAMDASTLRAGTYGRGIWQLPLLATPQITTPPALSLSANALSFSTQAVNTASTAQTITITNTGGASLTINSITTTGDYASTNTCSAAVTPNATCTVSLIFHPTAIGERDGTLTIHANVAAGAVSVALNGTSATAAAILVAPAATSFASTLVHADSAAQSVTVTNSGGMDAAISVSTFGDFAMETNNCAATLGAGSSCNIGIRFAPIAMGPRSGVLQVTDAVGAHQASLSGTGIAGTLQAATSITLPPTSIHTATAPWPFTIHNSGTAPLNISSITFASVTFGVYSQTNNCTAAPLAPGAACTITITYVPSADNLRTGTMQILSDSGNIAGTVTTIPVSGFASQPFGIASSPTSVVFASTAVGSSSAPTVVQVLNPGTIGGSLAAPSTTSNFTITGSTCPTTLAAGAACTLSVAFAPKADGVLTGTLSIPSSGGTRTVPLSGTGTGPLPSGPAAPSVTLAPSVLSFNAIGVGIASTSQPVIFTNNSSAAVAITNVSLTGDFGLLGSGSTCGSTITTVQPGNICQLAVVFLPGTAGARSGSLTLTADGVPFTTSLSGTGVDFQLAVSGSSTQTISSGSSAAYAVVITPAASVSQAVTLTCSGAPANTSCALAPSTANLTASSTIVVTLLTGNASASVSIVKKLSVWMAFCAPMIFLRKRKGLVLLLAIFFAAISLTGCGAGRQIPPSGNESPTGGTGTTVTPGGSYSILVSATAAGLTRSTTLTLNVQ